MTAGEKLRWLELCKDEPFVLGKDGDNLVVNAGDGKTKLVPISDVLGEAQKTRIDIPVSIFLEAVQKYEEGTNMAEFRRRLKAEAQERIKNIDWTVLQEEIDDLDKLTEDF